MEYENLIEIKKGQTGNGLLIEHDGYISPEVGENKKLFEDINSGKISDDFHCPYPFVVSAVFQKFGIENANGRIYPESVLKREVEKYMKKIREKNAIGECYRPSAMILTESGWKHLSEVSEGENVLTLNTETNEIEVQPIKYITKYEYNGKLINIKGRNINDFVTPDHGFPLYNDKTNQFEKFVTAKEIHEEEIPYNLYIPQENTPFNKWKNGIYLDSNNVTTEEVEYNGPVMCVEVDNHVWYVMDENKSHWTKNCNHPSDTVIDLSRVAMNIVELHWEGHTLVGKLEILTSPGFRKHGIISCQGDQIANLILQGIKIGVSSRGMGNVINRMGALYVDDDYSIICWDVVSDPSTPGSFISTDENELKQYVESNNSNQNKNKLFENLDNFNDWLCE